jgi:hypothetical protein
VRQKAVCRNYDGSSHIVWTITEKTGVAMDDRRHQFMLAFVAYMNLRQIEDEELRRRLIADMNCKLDELIAKGETIPEITPERLAVLGLKARTMEQERAPERDGPEMGF